MPSVSANGIEIGYDVLGGGPPVVLLHGATSTGKFDFALQLPVYRKAFRVYLPDARGHGRTRWDAANGLDAGWLVDDLEAFADAAGLATFHLVGFSLGAMTALQFAVRRAERIRTLVVVGITTQREPRATLARRTMDPERIDRDDPGWAERLDATHGPVQGHGAWRRLLPAIAADVATQPLLSPRDLRAVSAPALVVCGDRDPFVPVDHAWGLARGLPDARLLVAPDCGHEVMRTRPAIFNAALADFYRSTQAVARDRASAASAAGGTRP